MSDALGRTALTAAGVIGGFVLAGPAGAAIGGALGGAAGFFLWPPKGKTVEGRRMDDLNVSFSTYGAPIQILDGMMEINGNYVWSDGLKEHTKEEDAGGKGAPSITTVTFLYTSNWRIDYCEGVAEAILKNWADNAIITDITGSGPTAALTLAFENEDSGLTGTAVIRNFLGDEAQLPGPAEQADKGVDNTSAGRGRVGQEYERYPLERHGNRIPNITALVAMAASEILPFKIITPDATPLSEWTLYSADPKILYVGASTVNRIDLVSKTVVDTWIPTGSAIGVDRFDRVWSESGTTNVHLHVTEGRTGQLLASMVPNYASAALRGFVILRKSYTAIAVSIDGGLVQARYDHAAQTLTNLRDANDTFPYSVSNWFPGTYALGAGFPSFAFDSNDDPWLSINSGTDGTLVRFDGVTGDPVEQVVLTGVKTTRIAYYTDGNALILQGDDGLVKFSLDSLTIVDTLDTTIVSGNRNNSAWRVLDGGLMYIQEFLTGNGGVYDVSGDTMVRVKTFRPNDWIGGVSNWEAPVYDPVNKAIFVTRTTGGSGYAWLMLDRKSGDLITVKSVIDRYSGKVDLIPDVDIDASEQTDQFTGYLTKDRGTGRNALEPLATAFNFRAVESDWIVKFPKRGSSPVFAITEDDLGAAAGLESAEIPLPRTWMSQSKLFETTTISHIDPDFDWQMNTQSAKRNREAIQVRGSLDFAFPGALVADLAAQIIDRILWLAWAARLRLKLSLNWDFLLIDPGDVGTVTKDGKTYQFEVTKTDHGVNGVIRLEGMTDESVAHQSAVSGSEALGHIPQEIVFLASTEFFPMDSVLFRDQDDGPGMHFAGGAPDGVTFPGNQIYRSLDDSGYTPLTGVASSRAVSYGRATTTLPDGPTNVWDRVSTLTINMHAGSLSSDTEDNVLNGANALLVGNENGGEVVHFLNATLNGDGTTTVDTLLRGEAGSEWATAGHVANEDVIVLTEGTIQRVDLDLSDLGTNFFYNAITLGTTDFGAPKEQTLQLVSQKPRAPAHVTGSISADDWNLTAVRRTRIGGEWKNLTDFVPLGESSENYEWDIYDGSTIVNTLESTTPSVTYTSAQQVTDFGGNQTTLKFDVRQMSATVGRGFSTEVTVAGA